MMYTQIYLANWVELLRDLLNPEMVCFEKNKSIKHS